MAAVFWDIENCRPPANASGYTIVNRIRDVTRGFGTLAVFRGYLDISVDGSSKSSRLRSELQSSGVSLIDCPHNGKKDVVDKVMMVDMMVHAMDHPPPSAVILITGDRDFAYVVATLRHRRHDVVIIAPSVPVVHISLKSQASVFLDWNLDILGKPIAGPPATPSSSPRRKSADSGALQSYPASPTATKSRHKRGASSASVLSDSGLSTDPDEVSTVCTERILRAIDRINDLKGKGHVVSLSHPVTGPAVADKLAEDSNGRSGNAKKAINPTTPHCEAYPTSPAHANWSQMWMDMIRKPVLPILGQSSLVEIGWASTKSSNPDSAVDGMACSGRDKSVLVGSPEQATATSHVDVDVLPVTTATCSTSSHSCAPGEIPSSPIDPFQPAAVPEPISPHTNSLQSTNSIGMIANEPPPIVTAATSKDANKVHPNSCPKPASFGAPTSSRTAEKSKALPPPKPQTTATTTPVQKVPAASMPKPVPKPVPKKKPVPKPSQSSSAPPVASPSSKPISTTVLPPKPAKCPPKEFTQLVNILREAHAKGSLDLGRSTLSEKLIKRDPTVYHRTGVKRLRGYIRRAIEAGIVDIKGKGDGPIILHKDWL